MLVTLGALLLSGLAIESIGRRTALPRVSLLLGFGFLVGPEALDLLPRHTESWFGLATTAALVMVGFLLGERLTRRRLRAHGRAVLAVSLAAVVVTTGLVTAGLHAIGAPLPLALVLGAIASATAPAATYDVVTQYEASGPFTDILLGVVAVDDAWGLLAFSIALAAVAALGDVGTPAYAVLHGLREIGGALLLGIVLGLPTAFLSHRVAPGEPTVLEALGVVLLCGGLALWLDVSFILAAMALGATTANVARRHRNRPFHAIARIEQPFMVVFFVLAGASLDLGSLAVVGSIGAAYVILRAAGRIAGAALGAWLGAADRATRAWMGLALMPQAGVALGMALVAAERYPALADTVLPIVIGATVIFELAGPLCTRRALAGAGEIPLADARRGPGR